MSEATSTLSRSLVVIGTGFTLVALCLVQLLPTYVAHLLVFLGLNLLLVYSLDSFAGTTGLTPFCHAAFFGTGAYGYALATMGSSPLAREVLWSAGAGFFGGVATGVLGSALLAGLTGWICLRFRGLLFMLATLACQLVWLALLTNAEPIARGTSGIYGILRPDLPGSTVSRHLILVTLALTLVLLLFSLLRRSCFGLALHALRDDERAACSVGIPTARIAWQSFTLSGAVAGLAGALYASYLTHIDPTSFDLGESLFLVVALFLGGPGRRFGPLIGAAILLLLPEILRLAGLPPAVAANLQRLLFGCGLALLMFRRPRGITLR